MSYQNTPATPHSLLSRSTGCTGWQCLTTAQRFGVIFSAIVVFLVASLVYMYSLGRACVANKERQAQEYSKYQNAYSGRHGLASSTSARMSTAPNQLMAWQAMAGHQPPNFMLPMAQPYMPPHVFHPGIPLVPSTYQRCPGQQSAKYRQTTLAGGLAPQTQPPCHRTRDPFTVDMVRSKSPGWRRRLNQILRVPVGRASTIQTDSGDASPVSARHRQSTSRRGIIDSTQSLSTRRQKRKHNRHGGEKKQDCGSGNGEAVSIRSNAATVYSDDFQIISPASSFDGQPGTSLVSRQAGCYKY
ncbi:hypothetical protein J3458_004801 [Metarhizium acridum]|uniref:uncharacterized protein n=1 Tax=Metarhizium acridum TaxID=92637 RepID=UPI001C6C07DE|nr:hypothetical protein J3458_004801 [Metarhizium acridum]